MAQWWEAVAARYDKEKPKDRRDRAQRSCPYRPSTSGHGDRERPYGDGAPAPGTVSRRRRWCPAGCHAVTRSRMEIMSSTHGRSSSRATGGCGFSGVTVPSRPVACAFATRGRAAHPGQASSGPGPGIRRRRGSARVLPARSGCLPRGGQWSGPCHLCDLGYGQAAMPRRARFHPACLPGSDAHVWGGGCQPCLPAETSEINAAENPRMIVTCHAASDRCRGLLTGYYRRSRLRGYSR